MRRRSNMRTRSFPRTSESNEEMTDWLRQQDCPALSEVVQGLDEYLCEAHPDFFGHTATHPILPLKPHKVIHDNLWGTVKFTWIECLLIDSPIMQRLKDIHQVGLAFDVYPCAHHKRFEHSLGVLTLAARTFGASVANSAGELQTFLSRLYGDKPHDICVRRIRQELRLAALLHDTGHSLFSHASEKVYSNLALLRRASSELTNIAGKEKGAGEVISFCLAQTPALRGLVDRGRRKLMDSSNSDSWAEDVNFDHISLMIIGRAWHPYLQFLGDIVSSAFDADKLDYLLRDATAAGLPLRYDLDRYLHAVHLKRSEIVDGEDKLRELYGVFGADKVERMPASGKQRYDYYEAYRLRLPPAALNVIEQIVICKMMLLSYLYHHTKVRATEGLLERMLARAQEDRENEGKNGIEILCWYLNLSDSSLRGEFLEASDPIVKRYAYRIVNRLVPREVMRINSSIATHGDRAPINNLLADLQNRYRRDELMERIETAMGSALIRRDEGVFGSTVRDALGVAGAWLDVPKAPKFTDIDEVASGTEDGSGLEFRHVFPVDKWTQAYTSYSYNVRVFAFSEHREAVRVAARGAIEDVTGVKSDAFYERALRAR